MTMLAAQGGTPRPGPPVRVLVCEDHPMFADAIRATLESDPGLRVIGHAATGSECLRDHAALRPDLTIVDVGLPDMTGIAVTKSITTNHPGAKVLVLSASDRPADMVAALEAGAVGYLQKYLPAAEVVAQVHQAAAGSDAFDGATATSLVSVLRASRAPRSGGLRLSAREIEMLQLIADGSQNSDIAETLHLSIHTVKGTVKQLFGRLGVNDRAAAVAVGLREHLIS